MSDSHLKLVAACAFGLEALVKRELIALGFTPKVTQPGRVSFDGDWQAVCKTNLWLRTADRVLVEVQRFPAADFEALFETIKAFDYTQFIPVDGKFPVVGKTRLSKLTSLPAIQRATKKAIVESLQHFHKTTALDETGELYKVEVALLNDEATITIDTTGDSLHKRGYRKLLGPAPIKQTLAAAMVDLTVWKPERALIDPFCGTGTIPIEAALKGMNIAPGLNRDFSSSRWHQINYQLWSAERTAARAAIDRDVKLKIVASDTDDDSLGMAQYHARLAGVEQQIEFEQKAFDTTASNHDYGCLVTNPPYGQRLQEQEALIPLYEQFPAVMQRLPTWSLFVITSIDRFEKIVEKRATRRRKLFNGRLECMYYQFLGPRPPIGYFQSISDAPPSAETDSVETGSPQNPPPAEPPAHWETVSDKQNQPSSIESSRAEAPSQSPSPAPPVIRSLADQLGSSGRSDPATQPVVVEIENATQTPENHSSSAATPNDIAQSPVQTARQSQAAPVAPVFGGLEDKDKEQAELFSNRLTKRARHLRRWPSRRSITCFRIYERDIPEIPLVVDRYEDAIHITEYERPHDRSLSRHAAWLDLMRTTAAETLNVPKDKVFLKTRQKRSGNDQYEKIDTRNKMTTVTEGGLKFLVNLSDYVDTGLFLDHRVTRGMVRAEAQGKSFLNLFAYTGSFTVYAVAGGAKHTTTVDLSKNYLQWAHDNLKSNNIDGPTHQFIAGDSMEFLETAAADDRQRFDLAVVDPPTYSNSKRTDQDWDVQQQHVELLTRVAEVMTTGGVVYFSTNFRKFRPRFDELTQYDITEISNKTVPEDFRNRRIHRCWKMVKLE